MSGSSFAAQLPATPLFHGLCEESPATTPSPSVQSPASPATMASRRTKTYFDQDAILRRTTSSMVETSRISRTTSGTCSPLSWEGIAQAPTRSRNNEWLESLGFDLSILKIRDRPERERENLHPNSGGMESAETSSSYRSGVGASSANLRRQSSFNVPTHRAPSRIFSLPRRHYADPSPRAAASTSGRIISPSMAPNLPPSRRTISSRRFVNLSAPPSAGGSPERRSPSKSSTGSRTPPKPLRESSKLTAIRELFDAQESELGDDRPESRQEEKVEENDHGGEAVVRRLMTDGPPSVQSPRLRARPSVLSSAARRVTSRSVCDTGSRRSSLDGVAQREMNALSSSVLRSGLPPSRFPVAQRRSMASLRRLNSDRVPQQAIVEERKAPFRCTRKTSLRMGKGELRGRAEPSDTGSEAADNIRWSANRVKQEVCAAFGELIEERMERDGSYGGRALQREHAGTGVMLTPVKASRVQRELLGTDVVLAPVRRSRRTFGDTRSLPRNLGEGTPYPVNKTILEGADYAYVTNHNMRQTVVEEPSC